MSTTPRLLVGLPLRPDESVPSVVQRHCAANSVLKVGDFLGLVSAVANQPVRGVSDLVCSQVALSAMEKVTRLPAGALQPRMLWPIEGVRGPVVRQGEHQWPMDARVSPHQALCPLCLVDAGYGRAEWEFVQAPVCATHAVALVERCHRCGSHVASLRTTPLHCQACGAPLSEAPAEGVSDTVLRAAKLVQSTTVAGFGSLRYTAPFSPRDLSDLLRLCVLPPAGAGAGFGLEGPLYAIPVASRLAALDALGRALTGRTIDADVLRPHLMRRWLHAPLLGLRQRRRLLAGACGELGMMRDVANLVCDGREDVESETAVQLLGPRLPSLQTRADVARFLGIDESVLVCLERVGLRLASPAPGHGHDMDEVLALRHALDEALSLGEVDQVLGLPSLADCLVQAKVLHAIRLRDELLVHADSVTSLFSGVQRAVAPRDASTRSVRLSEWAARVDSIELATAAIVWVLGGSLLVTAWDEPYRLVDVSLDALRLDKLVGERAAQYNRSATEVAAASTEPTRAPRG